MKQYSRFNRILVPFFIVLLFGINFCPGQEYPTLKTPLSQDILDMLTNEISGQIIYNNEVLLAGAPWIRDRSEFVDTFYESGKMFELVGKYGIETVRLERYDSDRTFTYPFEGEFWLIKPEKKLIARLAADPALIAGGSTVDITGKLIYIPPLNRQTIEEFKEKGIQEKYNGKIALMWSHVRGEEAQALDAAGVAGVVSFSSRERYFDPNQVVYARGSYTGMDNLKFGFTVSWRQWSELFEDVQRGLDMEVHCKTKIETFSDKFETVFCWIPGTEPEKKSVIFTAHLFEGYTKRGANDNMSGCVIQLEILRALSKLIASGELPSPRRTIYFLWPNEISGTYEHFKRNPGFIDKLSSNINMDMCGEALRKNNSWMTMSECPNHLPNYLDGLAESIMHYVWRTNDIVYLPGAPRGRPGGQYFPIPMWEKNGSIDAFRYFIHSATGGSDHICFNNPMVAVPGIEFFTWPDYWYHADTDTPDKSDPTQMKRIAFIGAAMAWAASNCTDEVLDGLLECVSDYGYYRVGKRELPEALHYIDKASSGELQDAVWKALNLARFAVERETGAVESIKEIYSKSPQAQKCLDKFVKQWGFYGDALDEQIMNYAKFRASQLNTAMPKEPSLSDTEKKYMSVIPSIHEKVREKEFYVERSQVFNEYMESNPDVLEKLGLNRSLRSSILNFVNGERSVTKIWKCVIADTGMDVSIDKVVSYLELLKEIDWVKF